MRSESWLKKLDEYARTHYPKNPSHDYWHAYRVMRLGVLVGIRESADLDIIRASALLHDRYATTDSYLIHTEKAVKLAPWILTRIEFPIPKIPNVTSCIGNHEIYNWANKGLKLPIEDKVFQDVDRLDAMGAIGIGRCFSVGGESRRALWLPGEKREIYYKPRTGKSSVTHFYEKLLRLKDAMNTETGREIAEHRHRFMEQFLEEFFLEWNAEK
jgi:uncharacterized protein